MKKLLSVFVLLAMLTALCACGAAAQDTPAQSADTEPVGDLRTDEEVEEPEAEEPLPEAEEPLPEAGEPLPEAGEPLPEAGESAETADEPERESVEITITTDNWSDYFEFDDTPVISYDGIEGFGDIRDISDPQPGGSVGILNYYFVLREEYRDRLDESKQSGITQSAWECENETLYFYHSYEDCDNGAYYNVIETDNEVSGSAGHPLFLYSITADNDYRALVFTMDITFAVFRGDEYDGMIVHIPNGLEFTGIEGVLYLYE